MEFIFNDGGREDAGFKGETGDCGLRAVAIALELPYTQAREELMQATADFREAHPRSKKAKRMKNNSVLNGVWREVLQTYLKSKGWVWTPTMQIGSGTTVHMDADELPSGRIIVRPTKHFAAVIDGVLNDTWDCSEPRTYIISRPGCEDDIQTNRRAVYGYFQRAIVNHR
jgi:hypothetical protein